MSAAPLLLALAWTLRVWVALPPTPAQVAANARSAAAGDDEVTVLGDRMRRVKLVVGIDRKTGFRSCKVRAGSGDPALDAAVCAGAVACANTTVVNSGVLERCLGPKLQAIIDARNPDRASVPPPAGRDR